MTALVSPSGQAPTPGPLDARGVVRYLKDQMQADFAGKGLAQYFSLTTVSSKRVRTPPKGATIHATLEQAWGQLRADLGGLTTDTRAFRRTLVLQVAAGPRPQFLTMRVTLTRRPVAASEQAQIEQTLVEVDAAHAYNSKKGLMLEATTYAAFQRLYAAAEAAGLTAEVPGLFRIISDYRSVKEQKGIWDKKCDALGARNPTWTRAQIEKAAQRWVARPGGSAHHTGRAVDLYMGWSIGSGNATKMLDSKSDLYKQFGKYWLWLRENGPRFGFLPYAGEPWHWEAWLA